MVVLNSDDIFALGAARGKSNFFNKSSAYVKELNAAGLNKMVQEVEEWYASTQAN